MKEHEIQEVKKWTIMDFRPSIARVFFLRHVGKGAVLLHGYHFFCVLLLPFLNNKEG